jgi:two-component system NtrC family sensor kinase
VAHEINTPLAVISSYAQMLSKQLKGDARLGPVLDKITQQSFRAAEIANGLLNFSRTSTTEFRDRPQPGHPRHAFAARTPVQDRARSPSISNLAEELPLIHGNPGKLQQVFLNLLLNAKEAMPEGGSLRVATLASESDNSVEALVADSGAGIAPEHPEAHLRSLFHHQNQARTGQTPRHRPGAFRLLRHHPGARWQDPRRKRGRRRHNLSSRVSNAEEFRTCLRSNFP